MSKFKGTPGPWQVDGHQNGAIWNIDDMAGEAVAMAFPRPSDREYSERTANAQLIAKAPQLLAKVQQAVNALRAVGGRLPPYMCDLASDCLDLADSAENLVDEITGENHGS